MDVTATRPSAVLDQKCLSLLECQQLGFGLGVAPQISVKLTEKKHKVGHTRVHHKTVELNKKTFSK